MTNNIYKFLYVIILILVGCSNTPNYANYANSLEEAKQKNYKLLIMLSRDICPLCDKADKIIQQNIKILKEKNIKYIILNAEKKTDVNLFFNKYKVLGDKLPFLILINKNEEKLSEHVGRYSKKELYRMINSVF